MNKNFVFGAITVLVLLGGSVWFFVSNKPAEEKMMEKTDTTLDTNMKAEGYQGNVIAGKTSPYLEFNKNDYDKAINEGKFIVLNFYANWCPICRPEQKEWQSAFNEITDLNVIGFRVNYNDSDTDEDEKKLAKEFDITYQHTKVILKNGKEIFKVTEQWDKDQILSQVDKYK
ncbi:thioredoxin family protein [Candidatus Gottesmanbacteria bacterium]|nr:thioredoxin family protein [Candidatus Gottesmanbacteria bacterium]